MDIDEEEEDNNADAEGEEEGEEDEEALRHKRKHFGYSKHYDPVSIKVSWKLYLMLRSELPESAKQCSKAAKLNQNNF